MRKQHRRSLEVIIPGWVVGLANVVVFTAGMAAVLLIGLAVTV